MLPFHKGVGVPFLKGVYVFTHTLQRWKVFHRYPFPKVLPCIPLFPKVLPCRSLFPKALPCRTLFSKVLSCRSLFSKVIFHLLLGTLGFCSHADLHKLFGLIFCFLDCSHSFLEHILDGLELTLVSLGQLLLHFLKCFVPETPAVLACLSRPAWSGTALLSLSQVLLHSW